MGTEIAAEKLSHASAMVTRTPGGCSPSPLGRWMRWVVMPLLLVVLLPCCEAGAPKPHPDDENIRKFLTHYFATWSAKDMDGYGACFHPQARVIFLDAGGRVLSEGLTDFLHGQKMGHERAPVPMVEKPVSMELMGDNEVVQAKVKWVLTKGSEETRGVDYFTLKREGEGWKIVTLVFYNE